MTYNQIRFVKRVLAVVLFCFGGVVAYQFYISLHQRKVTRDTPLPEEPDNPLARGVELTRLDSQGKRAFVLRAAESIGTDGESQTFRDVEIEFEAGTEAVPLTVTADICRFDHESSAAHLEDNVVIRDQESLRVETSAIDFRRNPDRVWTDDSVRFFRNDMEGEAGNLDYSVPAVTWKFGDGVRVRLLRENAPPIDIESRRAVIRRRQSLVRFVDDVVVLQEDRRLRCNDLQLYLTADESAIEHVEAFENVELVMNTPSPGRENEDTPESQANRLRILEEPGTKRLLAEKLEVMYREGDGNIERMRARERGKLIFESLPARDGSSNPAMRREIDGYVLVFEFDPVGRLTKLLGRGGVTLTIRPTEGPEAAKKQVTARRLEADFDPETGDLIRARCIRSVEFIHGDVRAEAGLGVYDAGTEMMTLTQSPRLWDARADLTAKTIQIEVVTGDLEARKGVRSTLNKESSDDGKGIFPVSGGGPVHFVADHLRYQQSEDLAVYTGAARGFQNENRIEADRIELSQEKGELEAEGSVRTVMFQRNPKKDSSQRTVTRAEHFVYDSGERVLRYRRSVAMNTEDLTVNGGRINVTLEPDDESVQEIYAEEDVEIVTPEGRAHGDNAKYLPKSDEVNVSGERAWLENGDKVTEGKDLTFFLSDDRIFVDGREQSRTKTIYTSKPRPF